LNTFDTVEVLFEFTKAVRHGLISLESLNSLEGVDRQKVNTLAESVRRTHADVTGYLVTLIPVPSNGGAGGE
jgi:hypothetical protein